MSRHVINRICFTSTCSAALMGGVVSLASELKLEAECYATTVLEREPFVVRLRFINLGNDIAMFEYSNQDASAIWYRSRLELTDAKGCRWIASYYGPGLRSALAVRAQFPLDPGGVVELDRVFCLGDWKDGSGGWTFLPPGDYRVRALVDGEGRSVYQSDEWGIQIQPAKDQDVSVRDSLTLEHMAFLLGKDPPKSELEYEGADCEGNRPPSCHFKVFGELLRDHPNSQYTRWVTHRRLMYKGARGEAAEDEALTFVHEHVDFPLSDNLLLSVAYWMRNKGKLRESESALQELQRLFPRSDVSADSRKLLLELREGS